MKSKSRTVPTWLMPILQSDFVVNFVVNAFFSYIGLVMPGYIIAQTLFAFELTNFEPQLYHFFAAIPFALMFGALLYLLGVRDSRTERFAVYMLFLWGYGFFLSLIARAAFTILMQMALGYFMSLDNIFLITKTGSAILIAFLLACALYQAFHTELSAGNAYSASNAANTSGASTVAPLSDVLEDDSDNDSDSGDSSGDSGD